VCIVKGVWTCKCVCLTYAHVFLKTGSITVHKICTGAADLSPLVNQVERFNSVLPSNCAPAQPGWCATT
jgi:hypothetical protein